MKTTSGYLFQRNKDSNGKPCGSYYLMYVINGHKKLRSLKTENLADAKKARDDILTPALMATSSEKVAVHIAEARELMTNVKYPLETVWTQYLKSPKRPQSSEGTLGNYERQWDMFCKWLEEHHKGIKGVNQVTGKEAVAYAEYLWTKDCRPPSNAKLPAKERKPKLFISANTFNSHVQGLNLILKVVLDKEQTPFSDITRKNEEKLKRKDFNEEQLKKIFAGLDDPALNIPNKDEIRLLCYIGAYTGMRMVDAVHMKWSQIDFAKRMITGMPVKTRGIQREVFVPLHPDLKAALDLAASAGNKGYVMPAVVERYERNPDGICDDFHKILDLDSVGLKEIQQAVRGKSRRSYSFHSFRHTFASFAASAGVPIAVLAAILGDNITTLQKYYVKISDASKTKAIQSLPSMIAGSDSEETIDVKAISELEELRERIKQALKMLKQATKKDLSPKFTAELVKVLQPK